MGFSTRLLEDGVHSEEQADHRSSYSSRAGTTRVAATQLLDTASPLEYERRHQEVT
jgi:hypothetical protein